MTSNQQDESSLSSSTIANNDADWMTIPSIEVLSPNDKTKEKKKRIKFHIFQHPETKLKLYGLGISLSQFRQYVLYIFPEFQNDDDDIDDNDEESRNIIQHVSTRLIDPTDPNVKRHLRELWFEQLLIVDKTDVLTVYPSDLKTEEKDQEESSSNHQQTFKRGGAYDMISTYSDRLFGILKEEKEQSNVARTLYHNSTSSHEDIDFNLLEWLKQSYGHKEIQSLEWSTFRKIPVEEQRKLLQDFLNWFRAKFPYFYDRCNVCHSSYKEENDATNNNQDHDDYMEEEDGHDDDDDDELHGTFLGYIYPNQNELIGKATRTELYQCHVCHEYNRFPRFNSIRHIVTRGQGRCGEYSILLFRILRVLGHQVRWVVDWSDHVWTEVRLNNQWIHVDPCEAVLDKPLLYQEWGKVQTYIVAFWIPLHDSDLSAEWLFPSIEDVTTAYTNDTIDEIEERREENVLSIIATVQQKMKIALEDLRL